MDRLQKFKDITIGLRGLAVETNTAVVTATQASRRIVDRLQEIKDKTPPLTHWHGITINRSDQDWLIFEIDKLNKALALAKCFIIDNIHGRATCDSMLKAIGAELK